MDLKALDKKTRDRYYNELVTRISSGQLVTEDEFMAHFDVQNLDAATGIESGECAPDFALPDQDGRDRSRAELMGDRGLLLVFARSAHWCSYCRNQLAELNLAYDDVRSSGIGIASITPDGVDVLAPYARANAIRYPMLSDVGGKVIDQFGILNPNIPADNPRQHEGVPFPGHFLLSPDGRVLDKAFTGDLRHRASATTLVFEHFSLAGDRPGVRIETEELSASIELSTGRAFGGQVLGFRAVLTVAPGWHIYGTPLPAHYTATSVAFDAGDLLGEQSLDLPPARMVALPAVGETLPVFEGTVELRGRLRLRWSPTGGIRYIRGVEHLGAARIPPGEHRLRGTLTYQACSDDTCLVPRAVPFELPLDIMADVPSTIPVFDAERAEQRSG